MILTQSFCFPAEYSGIDFCLEKHKDKLKSLVRTFSSSDNYEVAEIASQVQKLLETYN